MQLPNAKKPGSHMGVDYDPNQPKATMGGNRNQPKKPAVPEFQGPAGYQPPPTAPQGGPPLPPTVAPQGPIFPQDAAQPIAFNGGYYNPTTAPFGFDMSKPGAREQFWNNNQNLWMQSPQLDWVDSLLPQFQDPWAGEQKANDIMGTIANPGAGQQYWTGVQGAFNSMGNNVMGGYGGPNNAQEAYNMTKGMLPGSMQPQFDAYYDRMKDKAMSDVNTQSAARGAYGSNAALNSSVGAGLDIEAARAKAATDFMLADSANQANWQGLLGNQARGADLSGLGIFDSKLAGAQFGLDKTKLGGELAFQAEGMDFDKKKTQAELAFGLDDQALERLGAGVSTAFGSSDRHRQQVNDAYEAAGKAQDTRDNRVNTLYGQQEQFSNDIVDFVMSNFDSLFKGDQAAFEQQIQAMLAQAADQRGWDEQTRERIWRDVKEGIETAQNAKEAGLF